MIDFEKMPILEALENYKNEKSRRWHMPGHKGRNDKFPELAYISEHLYALDVTEIEGTDHLHAPEQAIATAQQLLAQSLGAKESFFLVNGSTCGIYSAILGLTEKGDKVLVQRNCHQSVHTALLLGELDSIYLYPEVVEGFDFPTGICLEEVKQAIDQNRDAVALILTYPTYYGTCCDLATIAEYCKKNKVLLVVDEAHGAHFSFSDLLPESALKQGADVSINSFHKTLPSLTQTAVLNLGEHISATQRQKIKETLAIFQTSSPSYLFLASMDSARYIMETRGQRELTSLRRSVDDFAKGIGVLPGVRLLTETDLRNERLDFTRIVLHTPMEGEALSKLLRHKYHIQVEMAEGNNVVLIGSVMDEKEDYQMLLKALEELFALDGDDVGDGIEAGQQAETSTKTNLVRTMPRPEKILSQGAVASMDWEEIPLEQSIGRVSAEKVTPYPPGIPLLLPGEIVDEQLTQYWQEELRRGRKILKDKSKERNTIAVLKKR